MADYRGYLTEVTEGCPDAVIVLLGLCWKSRDNHDAQIKEWNAAIKALAEEFGVLYVDTYEEMKGTAWVMSDGLHPANTGYRVMASTVFNVLNQYIDFAGIEPDPNDTGLANFDGNKLLSGITDPLYQNFSLTGNTSNWTLPKYVFWQKGSTKGDALLYNSNEQATVRFSGELGDAFTVSMEINNFMAMQATNQFALRFMSSSNKPFLLNVYTNVNTYSVGGQYWIDGNWTKNLFESTPTYKGQMVGDDVRVIVSREAGAKSLHIRIEQLDGTVIFETDTPENDVVADIHYLELRSFASIAVVDNIVIR